MKTSKWFAAMLPLLLAGCTGALAPFPAPPTPETEVRQAIAERGPIPSADRILADATLVTFEYRSARGARRDTIRGRDDVAVWLQSTRAGAGHPFELRPFEIQLCDGAAVEHGRVPVRARVPGAHAVEDVHDARYIALWRPAEGTWKLESLWLAPAIGVRPASLATGCTSGRAPRESRRLLVGVGGRAGAAAGMADVNTALQGKGWSEPQRSDLLAVAPELWVAYRLTPAWTVRGSYNGLGRSSTTAADAETGEWERLTVDGHAAALLLSRRLGPLWAGAGPALARVSSDWEEYYFVQTATGREGVHRHSGEQQIVPGLAAELAIRFPGVPRVIPRVALGYVVYAGLRPHEHRFPSPADVSLGGLSLTAGFEWAP